MQNAGSYQYRLDQVVDFMQQNLGGELDLSRLAGIASFSPFHFHRIFSAIYQETPHEMLNRMRLEWAANILVKSKTSLTEIALQCGYSSSSVFWRAFKQHYGLSPSVYRKANRVNPAQDVVIQSPLNAKEINYAQWMAALSEIRVVRKPDYAVIAAISRGYDSVKINLAWHRLMSWYQIQPNLPHSPLYFGVSFDDPIITAPEKCRYYACVTAPASVGNLPEDLYPVQIPGGVYAVCPVVCKPQEIHEVYMTLYRYWLPQSGYQPADQPPYDVYYEMSEVCGDAEKMEICIPVERG